MKEPHITAELYFSVMRTCPYLTFNLKSNTSVLKGIFRNPLTFLLIIHISFTTTHTALGQKTD